MITRLALQFWSRAARVALLPLAVAPAGCAQVATPLPPTATAMPPTATAVPSTATAVPSTATAEPTNATAALAPFTHLYAFGDSLIDNGNAEKLGASWPFQAEWQGRFSNGPVAIEVLASRLNIPLSDYAVGGARSGTGNNESNSSPGLQNTGGLSQGDQFKQDLKGGKADSSALYFVELGTNDFFGDVFGNPNSDITVTTDSATDNIVKLVGKLAGLGAKHFLVIPAVDLATIPLVVNNNGSASAVQFQDAMSSKLAARLAALGAQQSLDIKLFDLVALSAKIRAHPSEYGLTNLTDACQVIMPQVLPACATPDQYYYWDGLHPTHRVHLIFGEAWAALYQP